MLAAALALGLFGHRAPDQGPTPARPPVARDTHVYGVGPWRLQVTHDAFAQSATCKVTVAGAEVRHGRLIWRLGSNIDTSAAVWRIDAGAPRRQSPLDLPASANLANPSDGRLSAPVGLLAGAQAIEIRPGPRSHVRRLGVARLDEALAAAAAQGCAPL